MKTKKILKFINEELDYVQKQLNRTRTYGWPTASASYWSGRVASLVEVRNRINDGDFK
jgi:hypothetical protein